MGTVTVVNRADALKLMKAKQDVLLVNIMRPMIFGNPVVLTDEKKRAECVAEYGVILHNALDKSEPLGQAVRGLAKIVKHQNVALMCCCAPKLCHGHVIAKAIRQLNA